MKYLKILHMPLSLGARDKREIAVVKALGAKVDVIAKPEPDGEPLIIDGVDIHCVSTRPLGKNAPTALNRIMSILSWAGYARRLRPDIISGHDLSGLTVAWLATWFTPRRRRPKLVYDAHEFEIGRENRSRALTRIICFYERFLMKRCAFSIMVNDSIADEVQRIHRLKERPVVVRNIPVYWQLDRSQIDCTRQEMCRALSIPEDTFIAMYHGMLFPVRGIETLLEAVAHTRGTAAVVLGNGKPEYVEQLQKQCDALGITDRVLILPAVKNSELWRYVGAVDVGVIAIRPLVQNSFFSLPNKLFENIQSLTPVVASNFPELSRIVRGYDIGMTFDPMKPDELTAAIERMRDDKELYSLFKHNLLTAKEELCWERECKPLSDAFEALSEEIQSRYR